MDRTRERLSVAERATARLRELALVAAPTEVQRDAAIQRFEYSFEAVWKAAQQFLREVEGIESGSPKGAIRAARDAGLLSDEETVGAIVMADDRNRTAHTYNESVAKEIFARLATHLALLERWRAAMVSRLTDLD